MHTGVGTKVIGWLTSFAVFAAGVIMCLMLLLILLEIVLRNVFRMSTFVTYELVGYGLAALIFLGLGHAFRAGGLVRMTVLVTSLKTPHRRVVELLSALATSALVLLLILYFWKSIERNFGRGAVSGSIAEIPLWAVELPVLIGLAVYVLQLGLYVRHLFAVREPKFIDLNEHEPENSKDP